MPKKNSLDSLTVLTAQSDATVSSAIFTCCALIYCTIEQCGERELRVYGASISYNIKALLPLKERCNADF